MKNAFHIVALVLLALMSFDAELFSQQRGRPGDNVRRQSGQQRGQSRQSRGRMAESNGLKVGEMAPQFKLKSLDGKSETDLAVIRANKPVVLMFGSYT